MSPIPGAKAMGILAKAPMQKLVSAAMAAVAVTRSRPTSCEHIAYAEYPGLVGFKQYGSLELAGFSQTQVPPVPGRS